MDIGQEDWTTINQVFFLSHTKYFYLVSIPFLSRNPNSLFLIYLNLRILKSCLLFTPALANFKRSNKWYQSKSFSKRFFIPKEWSTKMASFSNNVTTAVMEVHSTNKPPLFDGSNYQFLSNRMTVFMLSYDYKMWDVVIDGLYELMKMKMGSEESKPKL